MKRKIKKLVEVEVEMCERCEKNEAAYRIKCQFNPIITNEDEPEPFACIDMPICFECSSIIERASVKRLRNRKEAT